MKNLLVLSLLTLCSVTGCEQDARNASEDPTYQPVENQAVATPTAYPAQYNCYIAWPQNVRVCIWECPQGGTATTCPNRDVTCCPQGTVQNCANLTTAICQPPPPPPVYKPCGQNGGDPANPSGCGMVGCGRQVWQTLLGGAGDQNAFCGTCCANSGYNPGSAAYNNCVTGCLGYVGVKLLDRATTN
jgi:hypothetical protein